MTRKTTERDPSLTAAYLAVALAGGFAVVVSGGAYGLRAMLAVAVGALLALSNLWILEKLVAAYLKTTGGRWAAIATLKAAILFALVAALVKSGVVDVLPLTAGFAVLPVGILFAGLVPRAREES
jgi:hypothetical protein